MPTAFLFSVAPLLLEALLKLLLPKSDDIVAPVALPPNADADTNGCVAGVWKEDAVEGVTADEDSPPNDGAEVDTGPVGFDDVITLLLIAPNVGVTEAGVDGFPKTKVAELLVPLVAADEVKSDFCVSGDLKTDVPVIEEGDPKLNPVAGLVSVALLLSAGFVAEATPKLNNFEPPLLLLSVDDVVSTFCCEPPAKLVKLPIPVGALLASVVTALLVLVLLPKLMVVVLTGSLAFFSVLGLKAMLPIGLKMLVDDVAPDVAGVFESLSLLLEVAVNVDDENAEVDVPNLNSELVVAVLLDSVLAGVASDFSGALLAFGDSVVAG